MPKFRKKPVVIEAVQWFKNGDHPEDNCVPIQPSEGDTELFYSEGRIVRYYRNPDDDGKRLCQHCQKTMHEHGWIDTLEGGHNVCPGDWIIRGVAGEFYPCKAAIFAATYEPVEDDEAGAIDADLVEPQASAPPIDHEVFHCPGDVLCEYCDRIAQYHDGAASKPDDEAEGSQQ